MAKILNATGLEDALFSFTLLQELIYIKSLIFTI